MTTEHPITNSAAPADVLDHASEFVELVLQRAPLVYRKLLETPGLRQRLASDNRFNHGKLYAWAEFLVFRDEFRSRFAGANDTACVNAFSKLFLKNDISVSNLVDAMEASPAIDLDRLHWNGD